MQNNNDESLLVGIDAGGTTYKCALASTAGDILFSHRVPVTSPDETLAAVVDYIHSTLGELGQPRIKTVGVGSFGPLDVDPTSATYGTVLSTPKPQWSNTPVRQYLQDALKAEVVVETDVNAALAAELHWGAAKGLESAAYFTVGTGVGAGFYSRGRFLAAPSHPEVGHLRVQRHPNDLGFLGTCAFHGDCLEGLASAIAIAARVGDPKALNDDHEMWDIEAYYLAQACLATFLFMRPQRILLGGGVMLRNGLVDKVRQQFIQLNNGYIEPIDVASLIQTPGLGDDAGLKGGVLLAMQA